MFIKLSLLVACVLFFSNWLHAQDGGFVKKKVVGEIIEFVTTKDVAKSVELSDEEFVAIERIIEQWKLPLSEATITSRLEYQQAKKLIEENAPRTLAQIREVYGEKRYAQIVQLLNRQDLQLELNLQGANDVSFMLAKSLSELLNLSSRQLDRLKKENEEFIAADKELTESFYRDATKQEANHFKVLRNILTPDQRKMFDEFFGKPIAFSTYRNTKIGSLFGKDEGVWRVETFDGSRERNNDTKPVDAIWLQMMELVVGEKAFQQELELTESQSRQISRYLDTLSPNSVSTNETARQRLIELVEGKNLTTEELNEMLLDHQLKWLLQLEAQIRLMYFRTSAGLRHSVVSDHLKLDSKQIEQVKQKVDQYEAELNTQVQEYQKRVSENQAKYLSKALAILNAEQRSVYRSAIGE